MKSLNILIALVLSLILSNFVLATEDLNQELPVFSAAEINNLFQQDNTPLQLVALSTQEMNDTQGAIAPLVAMGYMAAGVGGRFIVTRWVTQRAAQQMIKRSVTKQVAINVPKSTNPARNGIMAPNRQVAKNIVGRNAIREIHKKQD